MCITDRIGEPRMEQWEKPEYEDELSDDEEMVWGEESEEF